MEQHGDNLQRDGLLENVPLPPPHKHTHTQVLTSALLAILFLSQ